MKKAIIRWAGSKKQLLPTIRAYWSDDYTRYIEPFVGSGSLFFEIQPNRAVLGDLNFELIHALRTIRDKPAALHRELQKLPKRKSVFLNLRKQSGSSMQPLARAARFLYLNRYCFNGLYRTNKKGEFNVPYAPRKSGDLPSLKELKDASQVLKRASLSQKDFAHTVSCVKQGDFVYLDPPYLSNTRRIFSEYAAGTFSPCDLPRLKTLLNTISRRKAHFVLSYAYTVEARRFFKKWPCKRVRVKRNIAGFLGDRRGAFELLVTNIN